jgi:hypothetical protein
MSLDEALLTVWRQALAEGAREVKLNGRSFPVRMTPKKHLRQVDFYFGDEAVRGLEQNPQTSSRWAKLAREGHKVMQFLSEGRYIANVVDGKVVLYGRRPNRK